jgi:electron transport complex protein RnfB
MITPLIVLSGVGLVMAGLLAVGRKVFPVKVDERHEKIMDVLPGANCGGCGYPGCSGYATALIKGNAEPNQCPPGGADLAQELGAILGVEVGETADLVALVACAGDATASPARASYLGVPSCTAAHGVAGGDKSCAHGCLGLGSCKDACPFNAIVMTDGGLAVVVKELCTGCGNCVEACPRGIIKMVPRAQQVHVLCVNPDKTKAVKAACSVGCTGCKLCKKQSKAFVIDGALAHVDPEFDGEIPESAALACTQGSILDGRRYSIFAWLTDPAARKDYDERSAAWKAEEKKRKAAAKAAKKAKADKAKAAEEQADDTAERGDA